MNKLFTVLFFTFILGCFSKSLGEREVSSTVGSAPYNEEIVVESSLNVKKKDKQRQTREVEPESLLLQRIKRQFNRRQPQFGQSSSAANANANHFFQNPNGQFGAGAANAQAQGFQSQGPLGGFGATATNANTQNFSGGPGGFNANVANSGGQTYNLPGGHSVALNYANGYNVGPDGRPNVSNANTLTYTK